MKPTRILLPLCALLALVACPRAPADDPEDVAEGEGEGEAAGEGEGEPVGEGEGEPVGEGEGEPAGEGEGEGDPSGCSSEAPEVDGPFDVREHSAEIEDAGGVAGRTIGLTILLPDGSTDAPVVVLHPGFQLSGAHYRSYGEHLATRGIVAVLLEVPYALFGGPTHVELSDAMAMVLDWLHAESMAGGALEGAVDASRVVLAGHSLGGKIALLAAARDGRALGVFGIDPVDTAGGPFSSPSAQNPSVAPELMPEIVVPVALVGETVNATCSGIGCQACAPAAENFQQYHDAATGPAWSAELLGANHMAFLDDPDCGFTCSACGAGSAEPAEVRRLTTRFLTAFVLDLMGDACARPWLVGPPMDAEVARGTVTVAVRNGF